MKRLDDPAGAKSLLGAILRHQTQDGLTSGRIIETEAYMAGDDPASHAFRGPTKRNAVMFGPAGRAYIYLSYGIHYCFNVVTSPAGQAEAVLIRALEPLHGIELMHRRRRTQNRASLCNGPANLVQAMGIQPDQNGWDLTQPPLQLEQSAPLPVELIVVRTRVGLTRAADQPWRFYLSTAKGLVSKP